MPNRTDSAGYLPVQCQLVYAFLIPGSGTGRAQTPFLFPWFWACVENLTCFAKLGFGMLISGTYTEELEMLPFSGIEAKRGCDKDF